MRFLVTFIYSQLEKNTHITRFSKSVTHVHCFQNVTHLQTSCPSATNLLKNSVPLEWVNNSVPIEIDR